MSDSNELLNAGIWLVGLGILVFLLSTVDSFSSGIVLAEAFMWVGGTIIGIMACISLLQQTKLIKTKKRNKK